MKKIIAMLLALTMCISITACGSGEPFLGTWVHEWEATTSLGYLTLGNEMSTTIELNKNGKGKMTTRDLTEKKVLDENDFSWTLDNDVINISYKQSTGFGDVETREYYVYDDANDILRNYDYKNQVYYREK